MSNEVPEEWYEQENEQEDVDGLPTAANFHLEKDREGDYWPEIVHTKYGYENCEDEDELVRRKDVAQLIQDRIDMISENAERDSTRMEAVHDLTELLEEVDA